MGTFIACLIVIWLLSWPVRMFMRRARQRVVPPVVQVIIVQQPAVPAPLLTLEQELERIAGSR